MRYLSATARELWKVILKSTYKSISGRHDLCSELILIWISEGRVLQPISEIQVLLTLKEFCKRCDAGWGADLLATVSLTRSVPSGWHSGSVGLPAARQYFCVSCQRASGRQGWWASPRASSSLHKARQIPLQRNDHVFADIPSFISCFHVKV